MMDVVRQHKAATLQKLLLGHECDGEEKGIFALADVVTFHTTGGMGEMPLLDLPLPGDQRRMARGTYTATACARRDLGNVHQSPVGGPQPKRDQGQVTHDA